METISLRDLTFIEQKKEWCSRKEVLEKMGL